MRDDKQNCEQWQPVRGRVIAGILCEVSADGRRLRFKKGRRIEIIRVDWLPIVREAATEQEQKTGL